MVSVVAVIRFAVMCCAVHGAAFAMALAPRGWQLKDMEFESGAELGMELGVVGSRVTSLVIRSVWH